ncbi:MAG: dienelactone hydrolase family protein [Anaerolineae bacterium]|nr:dienelactone hydrolase family protein [Anaerolineae bacterium]
MLKKLCLTAMLLLLTLPLITARAQQSAGKHIKGTLSHSGINRAYTLYVPANLDSNSSVPLVLGLHQGGGKGADFEKLTENGWTTLADEHGFIVVYPDAYKGRWNNGTDDPTSPAFLGNIDDVDFLRTLVAKISTDYSIDPARIYATGLSSGAIMALRLACEAADLVVAIAPVAGQAGKSQQATCKPAKPVSVLLIVGSDDPIVPGAGGEIPGGFGAVISVDDTLRLFTSAANCPAGPDTQLLDDVDPDDGTTVIKDSYTPCEGDVEVLLYTIKGGGHTYPQGWQFAPVDQIGVTSQEFNANEVIWDFFSMHKRG